MGLHLVAVAFETADPEGVAGFWAALLERDVIDTPAGPLVPGSATQVGLQFVPLRPDTEVRGRRLHLHVTSETAVRQQETVEAALGRGAAHIDVGQRPDEGHIVLADPGENEFCVIEPHNRYLEGTGRLGEVACDGRRAVGQFWSAVLGWPLVWDQDEETAIQSPGGGTKVAWGGPPIVPKTGRNPQHFVLGVSKADRDAEFARLATLGAFPLASAADASGSAEFTDPDGNEFTVRVG